jgi:hypothetical protein
VKIKHKNTNIKTSKKQKNDEHKKNTKKGKNIRTLDDHHKEHFIVRKESSKF